IIAALLLISFAAAGRYSFYREGLNLVKASFLWDRDYYIEVLPGDIVSPPGYDVDINIKTNMVRPELEIMVLDEKYRRQPAKAGPQHYIYTFRELRENIRYRVKTARGYRTGWYNVEIISLPEIAEIALTYNYPDYTGQEPTTDSSSGGNIRALRGTTAEISVIADRPLLKAEIEINGRVREMKRERGRTYSSSVVIEERGQYRIILYAPVPGGTEGDFVINDKLPLYHVEAIEDCAPEITMTYPEKDIQASPDGKVEIAGRAADDIGISAIKISYHIDVGGKSREVTVKDFAAAVNENSFSYIWDLAATDALPGSVITYNLTAYDNNTLYGPGVGRSVRRQIEIEGFRQKHKQILREMENYREELFEMLEKSYALTEDIEKENFPQASDAVGELEKNLGEMIEKTRDISEKLSSDAYSEDITRQEFEGIGKTLENILRRKTPAVKEAAAKRDRQKGSRASREIEKELEKASKLTADALKREKMSDLYSASQDSLTSAQELTDMLSGEDLVPEDILDKLNKLSELLQQMQTAITRMPNELPEEFINRQSIKELDFNTPRSLMKEISDALKEGDFQKARRLIEELSKSLQAMAGQVQEAAGESYSSRQDTLSQRSSELSDKLKEIIRKQEELVENTSAENDYILEKTKEWEEERFTRLREKYKEFKSTTGFRSAETNREFSRGRLLNTPDILERYMENTKDEFAKAKIRQFLEELRKKPDIDEIINETKKSDFAGLAFRQEKLKEETQNIKRGLDALGHMSALLDPEITENINSAALYMDDAAGELKSFAAGSALESERRALSHLKMGDNQMQSFSDQLNSMPQNLSAGQSGIRTMPGGGAPGRSGYRE
ncbi:MAG: DUF4175 family protein, partial [Elusimicrobiota bacterium]|nr:DUF4175 family protein [Elusimicrobiota bacterium]